MLFRSAAGHRVVPLPGPSAVVTALSGAGAVAAGGSPAGFVFHGFLPSKGAERRDTLAALLGDARAQVLFEAPHRMDALLQSLSQLCPQRLLTLCRELTKQFEDIVTLAAGQAPDWLRADAVRLKGEFVVVIHPAAPSPPADDTLNPEAVRVLDLLLSKLPMGAAASLAAEITGAPRKLLYRDALARRPD